jgi:predicted transcriptional regulator
VEAAAKMLADGQTSYVVAEAMGVSRPALREALKRRGMWKK